MAYTAPTPVQFQARFAGKFDAVSTPTIQVYLDKAARMVDTSWTEGDFAEARMLLAAHYMAAEGVGAVALTGNAAIEAGTFIKKRSEGDHSIEFAVPTAAGSAEVQAQDGNPWGTSIYGQQFWMLLVQNQSGMMAAASTPALPNALARDYPIMRPPWEF